MATTMSALFDQAVRSYFGGDSAALPLPPGNAVVLRASQLADAQQVMAAGSYRANMHSSCMTVPDLHVPRLSAPARIASGRRRARQYKPGLADWASARSRLCTISAFATSQCRRWRPREFLRKSVAT